jgi:hypothetical protein
LESSANDHNNRADENGAFTPQNVSEPNSGHGTEEASERVCADFAYELAQVLQLDTDPGIYL